MILKYLLFSFNFFLYFLALEIAAVPLMSKEKVNSYLPQPRMKKKLFSNKTPDEFWEYNKPLWLDVSNAVNDVINHSAGMKYFVNSSHKLHIWCMASAL